MQFLINSKKNTWSFDPVAGVLEVPSTKEIWPAFLSLWANEAERVKSTMFSSRDLVAMSTIVGNQVVESKERVVGFLQAVKFRTTQSVQPDAVLVELIDILWDSLLNIAVNTWSNETGAQFAAAQAQFSSAVANFFSFWGTFTLGVADPASNTTTMSLSNYFVDFNPFNLGRYQFFGAPPINIETASPNAGKKFCSFLVKPGYGEQGMTYRGGIHAVVDAEWMGNNAAHAEFWDLYLSTRTTIVP